MEKYSSPLLRIGISFVFLWFGSNMFLNTGAWEGLIPVWITNMGISATNAVYANGAFEIILGLMLLLGIYVRWVALILAVHLLSISITLGTSPSAIRDWGLTFATFAIALRGADQYCLLKK